MDLKALQNACVRFLEDRMDSDPAHDISHVRRVVNNTRYLTDIEGAISQVTIAAAWLHDCVSVAKNSPNRSQASRLAADDAVRFLETIDYPADLLPAVHHAIEAHSFSAGISPRTLESKIVQDADRLEALGAIGIARCVLTGGSIGTPLYDPLDPFCDRRPPDDRQYTLDHFYCKLFKLPSTMQTAAGREEALRRVKYMQAYLDELGKEISNSRF
jgi:uncharacterized protein